jgi:hypothetical protein
MFELIEPSMTLSSTPVTVMVCGVSQFNGEKVKVPVVVASPVSSGLIKITTSDVGCASRTIVNVSVVPDSDTSVDPSDSTMGEPSYIIISRGR